VKSIFEQKITDYFIINETAVTSSSFQFFLSNVFAITRKTISQSLDCYRIFFRYW